MEKQNQSSLSLLTLLPDGKVENDVRITDKTVTGICTVYVKRTDNETEFLLREIGVAALDGGNLTDAVRTAVNQAYDAAISRISGMAQATVPQSQQVSEKTQNQGAKPAPGMKQELKQEPPAPEPDREDVDEAQDTGDARETDEPDPAPMGTEAQRPPVDLGSIVDMPGESEDNPDAQEDTPQAHGDGKGDNPAENGGIERIDFAGNLFPASDLLNNSDSEKGGAADAGDDVDPEYQKALDTDITIFGKLHDCNNWKAGKILNERPDVIVDFCHRNSADYNGPKYTGPRVEQKEALFKLYPDAVRKVDKAA